MEVRAKIEIVLTDNGQVSVSGPLQDKIACLGMLELAKDVVRAFDPAKHAGIMLVNRVNGSR